MPHGWEGHIRGGWYNKPLTALVLAGAALAQSPESLGRAYRESPTPARANALRNFAASHKDANGALANFTLAVVAFEQKRFADAIAQLQAAQSRLPQLADYTAYYLAAAHLETHDPGDNAAAAREAARVRSGPALSPFAAKSMVLQARAQAASGAAQEAARLLRGHYADLPQPEGDLALGLAYEACRDLARAAQYYQRVFYQYPGGDAANRAAAALLAVRDAMGPSYPTPTPEAMLERGHKLLSQHEYARAQAEFQALVPQLDGAQRDQARVGVGAAEYLSGDVAAAYSYLRSLEVSGAEADAERLYYIAECARKLNDEEQMMEAVKKLAKHHVDSLWRYKALTDSANRFLVTNQPDKFTPMYQAVYEAFPDQPLAASSHWRVAWTAYIRRKHDARELLREHLQRYPGHPSAGAALYFLGRLAETDRDYPSARLFYTRLAEQFPNYYYGILARARKAQPNVADAGSSEKTARFLRAINFPPRQPPVPSQADPDTLLRIARARLLASAGLPDLAHAELRFGTRNGGQPYLLAIEMARVANSPHERLHYIKSAAPDYLAMSLEDAPQAFWQLLFPLPFEKDLVSNANQQSLDPYMMAALIRQESEFNPEALSPKHAYGLTQVEPATGRALARRAGVKRFTNRSLFVPAVNLKLGSFYLRGLLDQWGGKWEEALASYNAGKSRVNEWITWNQYQEPAEFVESIPFTETREYVQAVLRNAAVYRQLYANKAPPDPTPAAKRKPAIPAKHKPRAA